MTDDIATMATPINSPHIIHNVFLIPIDIPSTIAKVIHIPGVIDTIKKVGINRLTKVKSNNQHTQHNNDNNDNNTDFINKPQLTQLAYL